MTEVDRKLSHVPVTSAAGALANLRFFEREVMASDHGSNYAKLIETVRIYLEGLAA